jgi:hypothetical protein
MARISWTHIFFDFTAELQKLSALYSLHQWFLTGIIRNALVLWENVRSVTNCFNTLISWSFYSLNWLCMPPNIVKIFRISKGFECQKRLGNPVHLVLEKIKLKSRKKRLCLSLSLFTQMLTLFATQCHASIFRNTVKMQHKESRDQFYHQFLHRFCAFE